MPESGLTTEGGSPLATRALTPSEAAQVLGVTEQTLTEWRRHRQGPPYLKLGHKTVRYDRDALEAWLASREVSHAS